MIFVLGSAERAEWYFSVFKRKRQSLVEKGRKGLENEEDEGEQQILKKDLIQESK